MTKLRTLKQDSLSLSEFINNASRLVDSLNYPDDARDRLLRDIILLGVILLEVYGKCIATGCNLTLKDTIENVQSEDSARRYAAALWPDLQTPYVQALRTVMNPIGSHLELVDFHPEPLHNLHTSKETAHIAN